MRVFLSKKIKWTIDFCSLTRRLMKVEAFGFFFKDWRVKIRLNEIKSRKKIKSEGGIEPFSLLLSFSFKFIRFFWIGMFLKIPIICSHSYLVFICTIFYFSFSMNVKSIEFTDNGILYLKEIFALGILCFHKCLISCSCMIFIVNMKLLLNNLGDFKIKRKIFYWTWMYENAFVLL